MNEKPTARIHLLPAKEAPYVVILRRKPSKTYHVIRWDTKTGRFEHGSWFTGHLYVKRCDVSFDGRWMVYLARGARGTTWNGVCLLPWLKTWLEAEALDTWGGGGFWKDKHTLTTDSWAVTKGSVPFQIENGSGWGEVHVQRMKRDGWTHIKDEKRWFWQFDKSSTTLEAIYNRHTADLTFGLSEYPELLDREVEWATFDAVGNLVFTRGGWVFKYSRQDLRRGRPGFAADLNLLTREMFRS